MSSVREIQEDDEVEFVAETIDGPAIGTRGRAGFCAHADPNNPLTLTDVYVSYPGNAGMFSPSDLRVVGDTDS